ncbi:MAG TPA: NAD(P)-dependent oxidoreductase [Planctomycetaceae bacterium]|nr:NAD(P)-dependent oxidoreductase [Planctomycetaceae bacterium]
MKKILVVGATGKIGNEVLRLLSQENDVEPIAAVRSIERGQEVLGADVPMQVLDLDDESTMNSALEGIDAALLLTGYTVDMLRQSKMFLDAASKQGVAHIVHIGASTSPTNEVGHWGWHQFVEAYIEKLDFTWTHLRPESFMQNVTGPGHRWLDGDVIRHFIGDARWTWIDCLDVAAVAAKCLAHADAFAGRIIPLGYDSATMNEVAATLSKVTGRTITHEAGDPEDFRNFAIEAGAEPAYITCVANQFKLDAAGLIPGAGQTFDGFEEIVGRAPVKWAEFAERELNTI